MATAADLLGGWALVSWIIQYPDKETEAYPLGDKAQGRIHYAADGFMTATISRPDRAAPLSDDAARRILGSYMHYTGRWRFTDNVVTHKVDFALDPSLIGRDLPRNVAIDGDVLTLSGEDVSPRSGRKIVHILHWQRVSG